MIQNAVHKDIIFQNCLQMKFYKLKVYDKKIVVNVNLSVVGSLRKKKNPE